MALNIYKDRAPKCLSFWIWLTVLVAMSPCHFANSPGLFTPFCMLEISLTCLLGQAAQPTSGSPLLSEDTLIILELWAHISGNAQSPGTSFLLCHTFHPRLSRETSYPSYPRIPGVRSKQCSKFCRGSHLDELNAEVPRNPHLSVSQSTPATHLIPIEN